MKTKNISGEKKEKIVAVVVTYNRKELLKECLKSLMSQSYPLNSIIIINNASTDGTEKMLKKEFLKNKIFDYVELKTNTGGAGGFYEGIKRAYEKGFDWIWCMDDDTIPHKDSLKELIKAKKKIEKEVGYLSSQVFWKKNELHKMNLPGVINKKEEGNIVKIRNASFVSMFISRNAVKKVGLPIKEFFIWLDDYEYSLRISNEFDCFLVKKSKVLHKTKENYKVDYKDINKDNLWKYKLEMRNRVYIIKTIPSLEYKLKNFIKIEINFIEIIFLGKIIFLPCLLREVVRGFFLFNPKAINSF